MGRRAADPAGLHDCRGNHGSDDHHREQHDRADLELRLNGQPNL